WFKLNEKPKTENAIAQVHETVRDVMPGGEKAILTLGDGSNIVLDNSKNGELAVQGDSKVLKLKNGELSYKTGSASAQVLYNTISTPKGGQYKLTLPDR